MGRCLRMLLGVMLFVVCAREARAQDEPISLSDEDEPPMEEEPGDDHFDRGGPPQRPLPESRGRPAAARASRDASPPSAAAGDRMFGRGGVAIFGGIGSSQWILLGLHSGGALFGVGLAAGYEPSGILVGEYRTTDHFSLSFASSFAYMAYDARPLAFGPEFALEAGLVPTFFDRATLRFGFAMWYAPFDAPLYLGTMIGMRVDFATNSDPSFGTDYPGLRLRWGF